MQNKELTLNVIDILIFVHENIIFIAEKLEIMTSAHVQLIVALFFEYYFTNIL